ncbi:MAG TPA: fibronectin type III domain-containing protein [Acidobacteriaceae bacterium]|nr:fibronectin type III domain-containing protein [Acidobacteriaceae bacterium]
MRLKQDRVKQGAAPRNASRASSAAFPCQQTPGLRIGKLLWLLPLLVLTSCGSTIMSPSANLTGASSIYAVRLTWTPPGGSDPAVSYNVYRELSGGAIGFAQINSSPVAAATYTDKAVGLGVSYTYVVRAMDAQGEESDPSNTATFTIPSS